MKCVNTYRIIMVLFVNPDTRVVDIFALSSNWRPFRRAMKCEEV